MARARNIKPAFFQNEQLGELTPLERLAFIGMWTIADFKGCFEFRPKRLKVQLLPYDNCDLEEIAINLDKSGLIRMYSVQGQRYIKILNFEKHQNPHKNEREAGSNIPGYEEKYRIINGLQNIQNNPEQNGTTPADSLLLIPDSLLLNPSSLIPELEAKKKIKPKKTKIATRLPEDWTPTDEDIAFCRSEKPHLNPNKIADKFRDYWIAQVGAKAKKADWPATWRNWVRNDNTLPLARGSPKTFQTRQEKTQTWVDKLLGNEMNERPTDIIDLN